MNVRLETVTNFLIARGSWYRTCISPYLCAYPGFDEVRKKLANYVHTAPSPISRLSNRGSCCDRRTGLAVVPTYISRL